MNGRDVAGHFIKGHPDFVKAAGVKAGRPKELKRMVKDALQIAEEAMPEIIEMMLHKARDPQDKDQFEAAKYLCDRIYGRPNQPLSNAGGAAFITFVIGKGESATTKGA